MSELESDSRGSWTMVDELALKSEMATNNVFKDGECMQCGSNETSECISCLFCKNLFHAIKCFEDNGVWVLLIFKDYFQKCT